MYISRGVIDSVWKHIIIFNKDDHMEGVTAGDVTFREIGKALNFISSNLEFTLEHHSDFENGWLPHWTSV